MNLTKETCTFYTKSNEINTIFLYYESIIFFYIKWLREIVGREGVKIELHTFPPYDDI